ncbi:MAG TPA: Gmad2 immunoglobulin-like domain-containing protein, partial [Candidatus Methylomirabilis sp.]|nr:Gmad2 immunoglobulin-like domain-containing protein [Candidatus Methylomirabilis sp.]
MNARFLLIVPALALLGGGCWDRYFAVKETTNIPIVFEALKPKTSGENVMNDGLLATSTGANAVFVAPPVKPGELASASGNVVVTSLVPNQTLQNPFVILGRARAFENVVRWRVRDRNGTELASGGAESDAPDAGQFGAFRIRSFLRTVPKASAGTLEVFTNSPRDGSEQDKVAIPVTLSTETSAVRVYFSNIEKDPDLNVCEKTYAVTRRVAKTTNVAESALLELLDGPSAAELAMGSRTAIVPGARLRSVKIDADVATADFSRDIALG